MKIERKTTIKRAKMMEINSIIEKKENNLENSFDEIQFMVMGFVNGKISNKDMTRYIKAIFENSMSHQEIFDLTSVMTNSGDILKFDTNDGVFADKHSTGGVSDSTTLIIAPIIALSGIKFMKMSGRKLGHTGGTIDKIEQFRGFNTNLTLQQAKQVVKEHGACIIAQTADLAPADKHLYKLRDETGYVMSLPLIASSVMSKKLACGSNVIVLDVKCGNGAFMKNIGEATALAKIMVEIGKNAGKKIAAVVSDMNQPLGHNVGSYLETIEAIEVLEGKIGRLRDLSIILASKIIELGKNISFEEAKNETLEYLNSGKALQKLKEIISAQGGDLSLFDKNYREHSLQNKVEILSDRDGIISNIDCTKLGFLCRDYCKIETNKGLTLHKSLGESIKRGEQLITLYGNKTDLDFKSVFGIDNNKVETKLVYEIVK